MKVCFAVAFCAVAAASFGAMKTEWGEKVTPENAWREYPRPQMVRADWTNLNGLWDYTIVTNAFSAAVPVAAGKILVPFAFESSLSGVGRLVEPWEKMIYRRQFTAKRVPGRRTLVNFEAVDWRAQVFVNGVEATDVPHEGGNLPFSVDVTDFLRDGENELKVVAWDPTHTFVNAGGKQNHRTHSCFYTRVSGIWQTVWMETVPEAHVVSYRMTPDIDRGEVRFVFETAGESPESPVRVEVFGEDGKTVVASATGKACRPLTVKMPEGFRLWTPAKPALYDFRVTYLKDSFAGYLAMRKFSKAKDAKGAWRFQLNNEFVFPLGTLDQGWWPDGLLTPPSLAACEYDIRTLKACGFDMMRKHIKVEPRLYYALCDRIGLMVFQDAPSPAGEGNVYDSTKSLQRYGMFRREWKEEMDHLFNVPSIVMWIPYNEGWGQPDADYTADTLRWTRRHDPSRLVSGPSGWNDYDGGKIILFPDWKFATGAESDDPSCDVVDRHDYPGPSQCENHRNRVSMLGEFGGLGLKVKDHLWSEDKLWGYAKDGVDLTREKNQENYLALYEKLLPLVDEGLAATVYTQTSDVEIEINGLMTYDRKVLKYDPEVLKAAHDKVRARAKR